MTYETPVGANMFAYCMNNPVIFADNGGEVPYVAIGAAIGGLIGGFSAYMSGKSIIVGAVGGAATGAAIVFFSGNVVLSACVAGAENIVNQAANHYIDNYENNESFYDTMSDFELDSTSLIADITITFFLLALEITQIIY